MAFSVEDCLADMVLPNSNGWGPALNPVWGFNSEGDPATGSYAYIDTAIRASDVGPTGAIGPHYPSYAALDNTTFVGVGETVQKFPWFVLDDAYQKRNVSTNTRIQLADMGQIAIGLDGSILQYDTDTMHRSLSGFGSWYWFWGDLTRVIPDGSGLDQARLETDGFSIGAVGMPAYAGGGWCIHGFPLPVFSRSRNDWVNSVAGTIVYCRARKILHDPGGVDDRDSSGLMINIGADYSVPGVRMIGASMHNRWVEITNDWKWIYCTDISASFLRSHPPSGWIVGSSPAPSPTPTPSPAPTPTPTPTPVVLPSAQRWWAPRHHWVSKSAPAKPAMTTSSLSAATAGTSGSQSVAASGPGTVTFTATGLPSGATLATDGTLTWDTSLVAAIYPVTITPTSTETGAGSPVAYQWTVLPAGTTSDPGAWAPHLRKRLA